MVVVLKRLSEACTVTATFCSLTYSRATTETLKRRVQCEEKSAPVKLPFEKLSKVYCAESPSQSPEQYARTR